MVMCVSLSVKKGGSDMANYIQFINMGATAVETLLQIDSWDEALAVGEVLKRNNPSEDIYIIGFRFLEKEGEVLVRQSGIYYLSGEVVEKPVEDMDIFRYCKKKDITVPQFPVLKIREPFLIVYPFEEQDRLLPMVHYEKEGTAEQKKLRIAQLRNELQQYRECVVRELRETADALEMNEFSMISVVSEDVDSGVYHLDIYGDQGDFGKHLRYLHACLEELKELQEGEGSSEK